MARSHQALLAIRKFDNFHYAKFELEKTLEATAASFDQPLRLDLTPH